MSKKVIGVIIFVLILILALVTFYHTVELSNGNLNNLTELAVYSEGPFPLSELIEDIENGSYCEDYDNDTLIWMKSLGNKSVYFGEGIFVIMSSEDASKIPSVYATDVIIYEIFECSVLETHSLGNGENPREVLLVENVNYLNESIKDIPGGGA